MTSYKQAQVNKEKLASFALCLSLSFSLLTYATINIFLNIFGNTPRLVTGLIYSFYIFTMIFACVFCMERMSLPKFIITTFFVASMAFSYAFNLSARKYIWTKVFDFQNNPVYQFFLYSYVAFLLSDYIHDVTMFLNMLQKFAKISVVFAALHYISGAVSGDYPSYMTFSYNLLFPTAFLWICKLDFSTLFLAILGAVLILIAGCRGALVCIILSILIYYLFVCKMKPVNRFLMISGGVILIFVLIMFWNPILTGIRSVTEAIGLPSRTLDKLANKAFLNDSGRSTIQREIRKHIGITGAGLFGDRTLANGHYAHSIFWELLADFGWPFGIVLFAAWGATIIFALIKTNEPGQRLICVLLPSGCLKLFLSGSFLSQEPAFYLLLGVAINCISKYRLEKMMNQNMPCKYLRLANKQ